MEAKSLPTSSETPRSEWTALDQRLLDATLSATPAQRLAWLEDALRLAYASGALTRPSDRP
ncbi:MAG: hypothetical protein FJ247_03365 [Nitrospira sp.]|nr:hypothetical protein [Nitrospira sp.]